jgi:16S rRNA (uracil1498-N3)-methyltransferase
MPRYDFRTPRLFVEADLKTGETVALEREQANYLVNVMRLAAGAPLLAFNGRDGEWQATLTAAGKRSFALLVGEQARPQPHPWDLHYLFAPLKHARLDYMMQKAVEMGATRLQPVLTRHTRAERVNLKRMRANSIEAAEQCGILNLPEIGEPATLTTAIEAIEPARLLVFCDEDAEIKDPVAALARVRSGDRAPVAVLIGPEGGFADGERDALMKRPNTVRLALGPRILRADTAAVAALALVGAVLGDWQ